MFRSDAPTSSLMAQYALCQTCASLNMSLESLDVKGAYLSGNELAGRVPEELGQLYALEHLYLNDNALENHLPEALGTGCLALQTLEVHSNKLSGRIPQGFREGAAPALRRITLGGNLFPASLAHDAAELQSVLPECNVLLELEE